MKQQISTHQFAELSDDAKSKLATWSKSKNYEPLLNIGQMIEFLDENDSYVDALISDYNDACGSNDCAYAGCGASFYPAEELCDALWESVKKILNKD